MLRKHWLRLGSVSMIAGPDLVTIAVEPHEFLEFASGQAAGRFVTGRADLERRIAAIDHARDPHGRYRVNEFFCHADTWQMTMHRLVQESDVVLMDLWSFAPANHGCVYELGELLEAIELSRVAFVVERSSAAEIRGLMSTLLDAAAPRPARAADAATPGPQAALGR